MPLFIYLFFYLLTSKTSIKRFTTSKRLKPNVFIYTRGAWLGAASERGAEAPRSVRASGDVSCGESQSEAEGRTEPRWGPGCSAPLPQPSRPKRVPEPRAGWARPLVGRSASPSHRRLRHHSRSAVPPSASKLGKSSPTPRRGAPRAAAMTPRRAGRGGAGPPSAEPPAGRRRDFVSRPPPPPF